MSHSTTPEARRKVSSSKLALAVILTVQTMVWLDASIVNVALPHIQHSLHFSSSTLSWVLNAYTLTFGGLLLLGARAGDLMGRRRVFLAGIALFTLSSLAGGFAQTSWMLVAARAVQGIGGAVAVPAALALLATLFPEGPARMRAIGLFAIASVVGGGLGMVAGGMLTEWATWRWVMFVNVPVGLAVLLLGRMVLSETPRREGRFDLAGAITCTVGMTGVVLGLIEAGSDGWSSPVTIGSLAAGLLLMVAFVRIEAGADEPILPLRLLRHPTRMSANVSRGLAQAGSFALLFFLTQYLQEIQRYSPLRTGLAFLPIPVSVFLSSQFTIRVLVGRVPGRILMMAGTALAGSGLVLASFISAGTPYPQVAVSLVMFGIGLGLAFVSMTTAGLTDVAPADAGAASGLINVTQQLGGALGLAVLVTVFDAVVGGSSRASFAPATAAARNAIVHGVDVAFLAAAGFVLMAFLIVTFLIRRPSASVAIDTVELDADLDASVALEEALSPEMEMGA